MNPDAQLAVPVQARKAPCRTRAPLTSASRCRSARSGCSRCPGWNDRPAGRLRAHESTPMQQAAETHRQVERGNVHERIVLTLE